MKQLTVPFMPVLSIERSLYEISGLLAAVEKHAIDIQPWPSGASAPEVSFRIAHNGTSIFLQYMVKEEAIKAVYLQPNDPVYRDSCVEFFVDIAGDGTYYNFEFNCIGTCLSAYGPASRGGRKYRSAADIATIRRGTVIKTEKDVYWELIAAIPVSMFNHHSITSLAGRTARGNFYKCGEDLPHPHYLAWNGIRTERPDFHQPDFFGTLVFQSM